MPHRVQGSIRGKYGWTPLFRISTFTETLPAKFIHKAGEYPSVLYWAYNNELNRAIGLDLSPYLGRTVEVGLYKLAERLPEFMSPRRDSGPAVLVSHEGKLIGAWLDALDGRRFEEVTHSSWDDWIKGVIDQEDPAEKKLARNFYITRLLVKLIC
ncbi:MAG TPA: DUF4830 domain-containing protein [Firmicutes bacterium]|nr:DUF4830 domain-containing protein [Bacillota bacterium]